MLDITTLILTFSTFLSILYGFYLTYLPTSFLRSATKTGAILALALFATLSGGPVMLIFALLSCALGDYFLSRDGETAFLSGMGAFILGHLLYIPLFLDFGANLQNLTVNKIYALFLILFGLIMATVLWGKTGKLRLPVMGYVIVVLLMTLTALALPTHQTLPFVMAGAVVFALSDMVLSLEMFVLAAGAKLRKLTPVFVWWSYWGAQVLILWGILHATSL